MHLKYQDKTLIHFATFEIYIDFVSLEHQHHTLLLTIIGVYTTCICRLNTCYVPGVLVNLVKLLIKNEDMILVYNVVIF